MTKRDILIFIFKWKATLVFGTLLVVGLVTALVYISPPTYEASAKVLVERLENPLRSKGVSAAQPAEVQNTEIEILLSRKVMATVVDKLKPYQREPAAPKPAAADGAAPAPAAAADDDEEGFDLMGQLVKLGLLNQAPVRERWITRLLKGIKVTPVVNSNILEITYGDISPEWAAKIVNTVTETYLAHRVDVYSARGASEHIKEQMDAAYGRLQRLRLALSDYKVNEGVPALEEHKRDLVAQMGRLRERMVALANETSELRSRFNEDHQRVQAQRQKMASVQRELDQGNQRLLKLEQFETAIQTQEAEIAATEKVYSTYRQRYDEQRMDEATNVEATNVRIIGIADVPVIPTKSRLFFIAISVVGGLMLSVLIALVREYFDRRVNDPDLVERILGIPVLGSVTKFRV